MIHALFIVHCKKSLKYLEERVSFHVMLTRPYRSLENDCFRGCLEIVVFSGHGVVKYTFAACTWCCVGGDSLTDQFLLSIML